MSASSRFQQRVLPNRRGGITVLVAFSIIVLLILTAFVINIAYMQMVREQLRVACDASAKAALVNYGATNSTASAISFAQTVANNNSVGGKYLSLSSSNVLFGSATEGGNGVYSFTSGGTPTNSVQLTGSATASLFMTKLLPISSFTPTEVSTVMRISYDICLVLDRSASMAFDLSANEFEYPNNVLYPNWPSTTYQNNSLACYFTPPDNGTVYAYPTQPPSTASRWAQLTYAVGNFISLLQSRNLDVHVSLVTFAETYSFGTYSATEATTDVALTSNYSSILTAMNAYTTSPLLGNTNISAGLALAEAQLTGSNARKNANRTIILLTDGIATSGNTNIASIAQTYNQSYDIVTDTITFSAEAASAATSMQAAATNSNGQYYYAPTAATLNQAFIDIADSLPAVLIK